MLPARPRTAAEDGFTLVELLVAATLMMVVLAASLTALTSLERSQRDGTDRADVLATGRRGMERLTRELRQATTVYAASPTPSASTLRVSTYVHLSGADSAVVRDVTYACSATTKTCTRAVSGGSTTTLLTGVTNTDVFSYSPSTTNVDYVGIKVLLALRDGTNKIVLTDGVDLHNNAV